MKVFLKDEAELVLKEGEIMSESEALEAGEKFLGEGYKDMGNGRFLSSDGTRQFRMGDNDLLGKHMGGSHVNFEILGPNPAKPEVMKILQNIHIFLK